MEDPAGDRDPDRCRDCGGEFVEGSMALPLLGSPRFAYRLGTTEVTTEVAAEMCRDCGTVRLRARDPERIRDAADAAAAGAARTRPVLRVPKVFGRPAGSPAASPDPDKRHPK